MGLHLPSHGRGDGRMRRSDVRKRGHPGSSRAELGQCCRVPPSVAGRVYVRLWCESGVGSREVGRETLIAPTLCQTCRTTDGPTSGGRVVSRNTASPELSDPLSAGGGSASVTSVPVSTRGSRWAAASRRWEGLVVAGRDGSSGPIPASRSSARRARLAPRAPMRRAAALASWSIWLPSTRAPWLISIWPRPSAACASPAGSLPARA